MDSSTENEGSEGHESSPEELDSTTSGDASHDTAHDVLATDANLLWVSRATVPSLRPQRRASRSRDSVPYRTVLNAHICEVNDGEQDFDPLPSSRIGASFWSSSEKAVFFHHLSLLGTGESRQLADAIATKSEPEARAYILLLEAGVHEIETISKPKDLFSQSEIPAAAEVGVDLGRILDDSATDLSERVFDVEMRAARKLYDAWWCIDETTAIQIESLIKTASSDGSGSTSMGDEPDESPEKSDMSQSSSANEQATPPVPAAALLKPMAFLNLSQTLFMNSGDPTDSNWQSLANADSSTTGPAILRTAFDDLHNLVVSVTRRLIQTIIFQATSRLRARADGRTAPNVQGRDVHAALAILGMPTNARKYWATAARRCKVDVYTDSTKYRDGRPSTKTGVNISWGEAEKALGLVKPGFEDDVQDDVRFEDADNVDSDAFTDISVSEHADDLAADSEGDSVGVKRETRSPRPRAIKRKRALSPRSYDRAEDEYLESCDRETSLTEERRLREALGLDPLFTVEGPVAERTFKRARVEARPRDWKQHVQYAPPWAVLEEQLQPADFDRMGRIGDIKRKQREARRHAAVTDGNAKAAARADEDAAPTQSEQEDSTERWSVETEDEESACSE
ncbi:hypothetical protein LTR95_006110 [Oleoguttula sp. CCFEE 5521]